MTRYQTNTKGYRYVEHYNTELFGNGKLGYRGNCKNNNGDAKAIYRDHRIGYTERHGWKETNFYIK